MISENELKKEAGFKEPKLGDKLEEKAPSIKPVEIKK